MKIEYPHYNVTKPNEQHQFDLLYISHKYILRSVDVTSRYNVTKALTTNKAVKVVFKLEGVYEKGGVFKYPKVFQ